LTFLILKSDSSNRKPTEPGDTTLFNDLPAGLKKFLSCSSATFSTVSDPTCYSLLLWDSCVSTKSKLDLPSHHPAQHSPPRPKEQHNQLPEKLQAWKLKTHDTDIQGNSTQQSCSDKHHLSHHTAIIISSFSFAGHRKNVKCGRVEN